MAREQKLGPCPEVARERKLGPCPEVAREQKLGPCPEVARKQKLGPCLEVARERKLGPCPEAASDACASFGNNGTGNIYYPALHGPDTINLTSSSDVSLVVPVVPKQPS